LADDEADLSHVDEIIHSDLALASKVLGLANSAYYGAPREITSISRALVTIGLNELQLLALGTGLAEVFDLRGLPRGFDGEALWTHCMSVSWLSRELAERAGYNRPEEVMFAGFVHDLGKLVLATQLPDELGAVLDLVGTGVPYHQAERELGLEHEVIGYWLAKRWGLPEIHISAIRNHHRPGCGGPHAVSTGLVSLANEIVKMVGYDLYGDGSPEVLADALAASGLSQRIYDEMVEAARARIPSMVETWNRLLVCGGAI
jgi:putative nucleotidyltransferase with HDIG domain